KGVRDVATDLFPPFAHGYRRFPFLFVGGGVVSLSGCLTHPSIADSRYTAPYSVAAMRYSSGHFMPASHAARMADRSKSAVTGCPRVDARVHDLHRHLIGLFPSLLPVI